MSIVSIATIVALIIITKNINAIDDNNNDDAKIEQGVKVIKELEKQDILENEEKINYVQSTFKQDEEDKNSKQDDYIDKFSNSVIMGDSRSEALVEYGVLSNSSVIAHKGRNVKTAITDGDLNKVVNLSPKNIFLAYGMNDVQIYSNPDDFIKEYKNLIEEIQNRLPNSKIYVNSIFRTTNGAIQKNSNFNRVGPFNVALKQMCEELNLTYIDGSSCVSNDLFEGDGVHFKPNFNKAWLNLLINKANL